VTLIEDLSGITTEEMLLLVNLDCGQEWALEAELSSCVIKTWRAEDCLQGGLSAVEALALISDHHAMNHLKEQQKAPANAELQGAWDKWLNAEEVGFPAESKQKARRGWSGLVLPLVAVLLFVCCFAAAFTTPVSLGWCLLLSLGASPVRLWLGLGALPQRLWSSLDALPQDRCCLLWLSQSALPLLSSPGALLQRLL
jgi:hypothetical protein